MVRTSPAQHHWFLSAVCRVSSRLATDSRPKPPFILTGNDRDMRSAIGYLPDKLCSARWPPTLCQLFRGACCARNMRLNVTQRRSAGVIDGKADGDSDSDGEAVVIVAPERHAVLEPFEDWYLEVDIAASGGEHAVRSAACGCLCAVVLFCLGGICMAHHIFIVRSILYLRARCSVTAWRVLGALSRRIDGVARAASPTSVCDATLVRGRPSTRCEYSEYPV